MFNLSFLKPLFKIGENITGAIKQKGNGTNRAVLNSVANDERDRKAKNKAEEIITLVLKNIARFDKRTASKLEKLIVEFNKLD